MSERPCDIFGALPLELTSRIASCLELKDLVRIRRVSKRWQQLTLSEPLMASLIRLWDPTNTLSLEMPEGVSHDERSMIMLEHINAFQSGIAFDLSAWDIRMKGGSHPDQLMVSYGGGYIAWVNRDNHHTIQVLHLPSRTRSKVEIPYNIALRITHLVVSETMLCVVDNQNTCRVKLQSENEWLPTFELSPFDWLTLTARKGVFAIFAGRVNGDPNSQVVIWTLASREYRKFPFQRPPAMYNLAPALSLEVRISADEQHVTAFYTELNEIYMTRISLVTHDKSSILIPFFPEGDVTASPSSGSSADPRPIRELRHRSDREYSPPLLDSDYLPAVNPALLDPTLFDAGEDWMTIRAHVELKPKSSPTPIFRRLQYLASSNTLRLEQTPLLGVTYSSETERLTLFDTESENDVEIDNELNNLFMFKDRAYFWLHTPVGLRLHVFSLDTGAIKLAPMGTLPVQNAIVLHQKAKFTMQKECFNASQNRESGLGAGERKESMRIWFNDLHGDENYLVNINLDSLYVWSFDKHGGMGSHCSDGKKDFVGNGYHQAMEERWKYQQRAIA